MYWHTDIKMTRMGGLSGGRHDRHDRQMGDPDLKTSKQQRKFSVNTFSMLYLVNLVTRSCLKRTNCIISVRS